MGKSIEINDRLVVNEEKQIAYCVSHTIFSNQYYLRRKNGSDSYVNNCRMKMKDVAILLQLSDCEFVHFCNEIFTRTNSTHEQFILTYLRQGQYGLYDKNYKIGQPDYKKVSPEKESSNVVSSLYRDV